jgi:hypothetical protein
MSSLDSGNISCWADADMARPEDLICLMLLLVPKHEQPASGIVVDILILQTASECLTNKFTVQAVQSIPINF